MASGQVSGVFIIKSKGSIRPVALTFVDVHGNYDIAPVNVANLKDCTICRWSTQAGVIKAFERVEKNNPEGAKSLVIVSIEAPQYLSADSRIWFFPIDKNGPSGSTRSIY